MRVCVTNCWATQEFPAGPESLASVPTERNARETKNIVMPENVQSCKHLQGPGIDGNDLSGLADGFLIFFLIYFLKMPCCSAVLILYCSSYSVLQFLCCTTDFLKDTEILNITVMVNKNFRSLVCKCLAVQDQLFHTRSENSQVFINSKSFWLTKTCPQQQEPFVSHPKLNPPAVLPQPFSGGNWGQERQDPRQGTDRASLRSHWGLQGFFWQQPRLSLGEYIKYSLRCCVRPLVYQEYFPFLNGILQLSICRCFSLFVFLGWAENTSKMQLKHTQQINLVYLGGKIVTC